MVIPKPKTYRSKNYLEFIRSKPCLCCGNPNTIAHHECLGDNRMGSKCDDSHCLPLCNECHLLRHSKALFWDSRPYIDPKMEMIKLLTAYIAQNEDKWENAALDRKFEAF